MNGLRFLAFVLGIVMVCVTVRYLRSSSSRDESLMAEEASTDFDRELSRIDNGIAELRNRVQVDMKSNDASRLAFLFYRRAALTSDSGDMLLADAAVQDIVHAVDEENDVRRLKAHID